MSSSIFTPSNQVKLTNVSVVRLKKTGRRFELACYKNKVVDWRNRATKDLDQVLQIRAVFTNVSKGLLAPKDDLLAAFSTADLDAIIREILDRGELQVGERERHVQNDALHREVVNIIAGKCVNPKTRTPYPPVLVEKALLSIHFAVNPKKSAKQQAMECIKTLAESKDFPIARARMRLIVIVASDENALISDIRQLFAAVDRCDVTGDSTRIEGLVEPANYRKITDLLNSKEHKGKGHVNIESLKEVVGDWDDTKIVA